jgi:hypothetical protein
MCAFADVSESDMWAAAVAVPGSRVAAAIWHDVVPLAQQITQEKGLMAVGRFYNALAPVRGTRNSQFEAYFFGLRGFPLFTVALCCQSLLHIAARPMSQPANWR